MKKKKEKKTWELHRHHKRWTPEEEDLLKRLYPGVFSHELEERFGRRAVNIANRAAKLGIKKNWRKHTLARNDKRWSKKEIKRLKKLFPVTPTPLLLVYYPKRTRIALVAKARKLGLRKNYHDGNYSPGQLSSTQWLWSAKDIKQLRKLWQKGHTDSEIAEIMGKNIGRVRYQIYRQIREEGLQKKCKWWSKEDEEYLKRHYHTMDSKQIAAVLGKTAEMIRRKAGHLRITQPGHWSPEEIETLRQLWQEGNTTAQIAEIIGRTKRAVAHELARQKRDYGLPGKIRPWSKKERKYLIQHYNKETLSQIGAAIGRTRGMIQSMATRLNLVKSRAWTADELSILKKHYQKLPTSQVTELIGTKSLAAVKGKARSLGLRKNYLNRSNKTKSNNAQRSLKLPRWSAEDIEKLRTLWMQGHSKSEIGRILGKTKGAITGMLFKQMRDFGLPKRYEHKPWSKKEVAYLIKHYKNTPVPKLSTILGRAVYSIHRKARSLNLASDAVRAWTDEETAFLKEHYKKWTYEEIAKKLGRTVYSVNGRAEFLQLRKDVSVHWTAKEVDILKKYAKVLPPEEIAKKLSNRTPVAVHIKAVRLGLRKH